MLVVVTLALFAFAVPSAVERTCQGEYANQISLSAEAEALDQARPFVHCVRSVGTYECPRYDAEGHLRHTTRRKTAHGTAFVYSTVGNVSKLLTNEHVVAWPNVSEPGDGLAAGCRLTSSLLTIVDAEDDAFAGDDIALEVVAKSTNLDAAIVKSRLPMTVMPWQFGSSAAIKPRQRVEVRGYPLGLMKALTAGQVVSIGDHDVYKRWDHDDFVIDAPLSNGNSGSPVLAVSCRTGAFEVVGLFHAAYSRASAMNLAVGIDQLKPFIASEMGDRAVVVKQTTRDEVRQRLAGQTAYLPFGGRTMRVSTAKTSVLYEVLTSEFPREEKVDVTIEDGTTRNPSAALNAVLAPPEPLLQLLRLTVVSVLDFRKASRSPAKTRDDVEARLSAARRVSRLEAEQNDWLSLLTDDSARPPAPASAPAN